MIPPNYHYAEYVDLRTRTRDKAILPLRFMVHTCQDVAGMDTLITCEPSQTGILIWSAHDMVTIENREVHLRAVPMIRRSGMWEFLAIGKQW